jgi:glutamate-1-semialdehyde 2,1-aminomutase
MQQITSKTAYKEASEYIPGGVNSPVRALRSLDADPLFVQHARGAGWTDLEGRKYIDFCQSWGVFIHGYQHKLVNKAAIDAIRRGSSYGIPSLPETALAKQVVEHIPSIEQVRFVSSGTEAVMSAVRLARAFTNRKIIVKFDGCYHGHADHMLVSAGSGAAGLPQSSSAGVPEEFSALTLSLPFNDIEAVKELFSTKGNDIAAVILEPVPANMGVIIPQPGYLQLLREITREHGSLLIFDEVITGFRCSLGGVQQMEGVLPDLTTVGKIIGGGFPAAAFGGRKEIMQMLAPVGPVYQAGTLSGNPVAMSAGLATLELLSQAEFHQELQDKTDFFISELKEIIKEKDIQLNTYASMFTLFFSDKLVMNFNDVQQSDLKRFADFWRRLAAKGIYFSPSAFEASFISAAHTYRQLDKTLKVIKEHL